MCRVRVFSNVKGCERGGAGVGGCWTIVASPREYILYCSALPLWGTNQSSRWLVIYYPYTIDFLAPLLDSRQIFFQPF